MTTRPNPRVKTSPQISTGRGADGGKRYSWVDTPMELHGAGYRATTQSEAVPPLPTLPSEHNPPETAMANPPAHSDYPQDRKVDLATGAPYNSPRPSQTHPAYFAPYDDTVPSHHQPSGDASQQQKVPPTPQSPGPIPMKSDLYAREPPQRSGTTRIEPDHNPLHSPAPASPTTIGRSFTSTYQPTAATGPDGLMLESHLPGQVPHPNQSIKGGTWKHGLCECSDIGTCCTGVWCPCILYGKTQYRLAQRSAKKDSTNLLGYETINGSCAVMAVLCGCGWILAAIQHTRTRKVYDIQGGVGSDCVRALCCCCCTLIQDEKEIKHREQHARRFAGPSTAATSAPYVSPDSMSYPPPPR